MSYYIAKDSFGQLDLCHYGVKGMKWGIRRFQNLDGSLTPEGKARAKAEYKADNKKAFDLGRKATISARAVSTSNKMLNKRPYDEAEKATNKQLKQEHMQDVSEMKKHYDSLAKKYGKEAISDIAYDRKGHLNERVVTGKAIAVALLTSALTVPLALLGSPVGIISVPKDASDLGEDYYLDTLARKRKEKGL